MIRNQSAVSVFLFAAATLVASGAWAQNQNAAPQAKAAADKAAGAADNAAKAAGKAADKAEKAADKAEKAADKAGDKADKAGDKADKAADKAKGAEDRAARRTQEHAAERAKLASAWKGPPTEALRQEERRHAERLARLERIKDVAEGEKDKDNVEKATKLIAKENERHDKWMTKHAPAAGAPEHKKEGAQ